VYAQYLRSRHFLVEEASDGAVALEKAMAMRPVLVCTELVLPTLDGIALSARLRAQEATHSTIVIALTAYARIHAAAAMTGSFDLVLEKPCVPDVLAARVRDLIAESRRLRESSEAVVQRGRRARGRSHAFRKGLAALRRPESVPRPARAHDPAAAAGGSRSVDRRKRSRPRNGQERACPNCGEDSVFIERLHLRHGGFSRYEPAWFCDYCGHRQFVRRTVRR
jgi:CheY-like chemotaxis protein